MTVEFNGGERAVYRIEHPTVNVFDRHEGDRHLRIRFDVEGEPVAITPRYHTVIVRRP